MKFDRKFESSSALSSESFIRLADGQSVEGVFAGEEIFFWQHWLNKVPSVCKGRGCNLCADSNKPTARFRINFVVRNDDGSLVAKIFEQGKTCYQTIQTLIEDGYDLTKTKVKIKRTGSGMSDTVYSIVPMPNGQLNEKALAAMAQVQLHDLSPETKEQPEASSAPAFDPASVPF